MVTAWPSTASACPVCWSPNNSALGAFLLTGVVISVLPLLMIGIGLWWWRHAQGAARRFERRLRGPSPDLGDEASKGPVETPADHRVGGPNMAPLTPQTLGSAPAEPERSHDRAIH
jgi:hypothetical protein